MEKSVALTLHFAYYYTGDDCLNRFPNGYFFATHYGKITTDKYQSSGYKCNQGYLKTDNKQYKCLGNGQWSIDTVLLCRS